MATIDEALKRRMFFDVEEMHHKGVERAIHTSMGLIIISFDDDTFIVLEGQIDRDGYKRIEAIESLIDVFANDLVNTQILDEEDAQAWAAEEAAAARERMRQNDLAALKRLQAKYGGEDNG
jgi:hypothetical protein